MTEEISDGLELLRLGSEHAELGRHDEAEQCWRDALIEFENAGANDQVAEVRDLLAEANTRRLITEHSPTGWFEHLYVAAEQGEAIVPWDRGAPHEMLAEWAKDLHGAGRRALIVGCGLGRDSEFIAQRGFDTVAFDISPTAVLTVQNRFPNSTVRYVSADLLDPPAEWYHAFDVVVESLTVQSLPVSLRNEAITQVGRFVAPGGTLLAVAEARDEQDPPAAGPPWPLTRAEIDSFATDGLHPVRIENKAGRWRAEFTRAADHR